MSLNFTDVYMMGWKFVHPTIQRKVKLCALMSNIFALFGHITFKLGNWNNKYFTALFPVTSFDRYFPAGLYQGTQSIMYCAHSGNIFQHSKRNFVSSRGHVISSIYNSIIFIRTLSKGWGPGISPGYYTAHVWTWPSYSSTFMGK